ncbi:autorepressor SdpR family transcription factor [Lactiplantibacillus plantarum]|uniref:Transcription regulator, ArsR family n=1 Tax=Lactiplantibacillus plantarum CMPG5300 TaxID=1304889 RepID=A0AAW3FMV3_LACPN|nr:autorepressor SdpR family transcription factor [Lactiplantibacillus plantarum]MCS6093361.1 ArsR family transcriptional regulator [Lactobacillus sp. LMY-20]UZM81841.1 autorepressor SdpR family transcription factor [Lactiplantibacillus argentoratensis]ALF14683.1 ArsR family transcriptional regulator [Lactiplantibacillus plantarum]ANM74871.1 transcriptional regulator [Lactiplantibacillus plantarum]AOG33753.1 ArsR family transcriptional regulator [Lactiplantibacillus plantarum]
MALNTTFKAIADPVRRQILEDLRQNRQSAGEIAAHFKLSNATVSYHLKLLKQAGLVTVTKEKNYVYYELNASVFEEMLTWLYRFRPKQGDEK